MKLSLGASFRSLSEGTGSEGRFVLTLLDSGVALSYDNGTMNSVKIDGVVVSWTGWYFSSIESGHQACVEVVRANSDKSTDHLLILVDYDEFVPYAHEGDILTVEGSLRVLVMGGRHEMVVVADTFRLSARL